MGAELKQIGVYRIDIPRPRLDPEHFLGKFDGDDFHRAFGRAQREVRAERGFARAKIKKIEFRIFRIKRVSMWSLEDAKLRLKIEDPGSDMVFDFEEDPTVGNPLEFVHARLDGLPSLTKSYKEGDRESLIDRVAQIASGERSLEFPEGHPQAGQMVDSSTITQLHGYHATCEVLPRRFGRDWHQNVLASILRTDFALQYQTDGLDIPL